MSTSGIGNGFNRIVRSHSAPTLLSPSGILNLRRSFSNHELSFDYLIFERTQKLVERYNNTPSQIDEISREADRLFREIIETGFNEGDFEVTRQQLCNLLHLKIPELVVRIEDFLIVSLSNPENLVIGVKNKWIISIIHLEKQVSELINYYARTYSLEDENLLEIILRFFVIYENLITRLYLFSLLCPNHQIAVCQHLQTVSSSAENWLFLIENSCKHDQRLLEQANEIRSALNCISKAVKTPEIEQLLREIQQAVEESPIHFIIPFGDFGAHMGLWTYAKSCYRIVTLIVVNSEEGVAYKIKVLKRFSAICSLLGNKQLFAELNREVQSLEQELLRKQAPEMAAALHHNGLPLSALKVLPEEHLKPPQERDNQLAITSLLQRSMIYYDLNNKSQGFEDSNNVVKLLYEWELEKVDFILLLSALKKLFLQDCRDRRLNNARRAFETYNHFSQYVNEEKYPPAFIENDQLMMTARLTLAEKNYEQAVELFEKVIVQSKENGQDSEVVDNIFYLTQAYWRTSQPQKAIDLLLKWLPDWRKQRSIPLIATACVDLGYSYSFLGGIIESENYFRESISANSVCQRDLEENNQLSIAFFEKRAFAYIGLESVLLKQGKIKDALLCSDSRRAPILISNISRRLAKRTDNNFLSDALTFEQIQALAKVQNTVFLIYSVTLDLISCPDPDGLDKQLWVRVVHPTGNMECKQINYAELPEELKDPELLFKTYPYGPPEEEGFLKECRERFERFYEVLIAPIEDLLPSDRSQSITIVPEGILAHIPFGALKDKNGKYLIEKHPVVYAPSIQALYLLSQMPAQFPDCSLVIYNPMTPISKYNNLQMTVKEVQNSVIPFVKKNTITTLSQSSSTVARVLEEMPRSRRIHLACHGEAKGKENKHSVFEGFFRLTEDDNHPDGCLYAKTISSLHLNAELVFMSACHSGRGNLKQEGTIGPNWSFLAAGALCTVATHWPLPVTDISNQMIEIFYKHLYGDGVEKMSSARALQRAMLYGLEQSPRDPRQWAMFFLTGIDRIVN